MVFQWERIPKDDAAGKASNDTTEVDIGTIDPPSWAKSIVSLHAHLTLLALTTQERVSGYIRIHNKGNTIDPLNFPLPQAVALTGAIATHISPLEITVPCYSKVDPNDQLTLSAALDEASTGIHTIQAHILFSSNPPPMLMHGEKSAVVAGNGTANTKSAVTDMYTIAGKTKQIIGFANNHIAFPTAAETMSGYMLVTSALAGWLEQRLPLSTLGSGLSTQITPFARPSIFMPKELRTEIEGFNFRQFPEAFPVKGRQLFKFATYFDGTNTDVPDGRYFMYWIE